MHCNDLIIRTDLNKYKDTATIAVDFISAPSVMTLLTSYHSLCEIIDELNKVKVKWEKRYR